MRGFTFWGPHGRTRARPGVKKPQVCRSIGYYWRCPEGACFDETKMDRLLYGARAEGVVTEHDSGRGTVVWFNGPPGAALRAVRAKVIALLPPGCARR